MSDRGQEVSMQICPSCPSPLIVAMVVETLSVGAVTLSVERETLRCPHGHRLELDRQARRNAQIQTAAEVARSLARSPSAFRFVRKSLGLTQKEAAAELSTNEDTVGRWEREQGNDQKRVDKDANKRPKRQTTQGPPFWAFYALAEKAIARAEGRSDDVPHLTRLKSIISGDRRVSTGQLAVPFPGTVTWKGVDSVLDRSLARIKHPAVPHFRRRLGPEEEWRTEYAPMVRRLVVVRASLAVAATAG